MVILNFGHNQKPDEAVDAVASLAGKVHDRWPAAQLVVTLQNPATTDAADDQRYRVNGLRKWAEDEGVPVVDAWSAFENAEGGPSRLLLDDGTHPNEQGTAAWVGAVRQVMES